MSLDYVHAKPDSKPARPRSLANARRLAAEIFGAFVLTLSATAPDVLAHATGATFSEPLKAFMPGMAVAFTIYAVGDVSGAHLNPAVTVAFAVRRVFPLSRVPGYLIAQSVGALLAVGLLRARFGNVDSLGSNHRHTDVATAFGSEILLTTVLVIVILNVATKESLIGPQAAIPVGLAISLDGLLGSSLSGASMNPARSLAPAVASGQFDSVWLYVVGPLLGALLACGATWVLHGRQDGDERDAAQGNE